MAIKTLKQIEENKLNEMIEQAKEIAKDDYEKAMKRVGAFNPKFKRQWRKNITDNGDITFALNGTPDKAFVFVYNKIRKIVAVRSDKSIIKQFSF